MSFEPLGKKVRLIIAAADEELVCRKETIKNLKNFLIADETKIFRGRLQLCKPDNVIEIIMKDKPIAIISFSSFERVLNKLH